MHLYSRRDVRQAILRQLAEIFTHLGRCQLDLADQLMLHLLHYLLLPHHLLTLILDLGKFLTEIFLQFLARPDLVHSHVHPLIHALDHLVLVHGNTIDLSLIQI